jgi:A/G-specific adenine glycosylase
MFPVKAARSKGKLRSGAAFVVLRAGSEVLLRHRPDAGLLGGMTEVPTTVWSETFKQRAALLMAPELDLPTPAAAHNGFREASPMAWRRLPGVVTHVFTHFPLELVVYVAHVPAGTQPDPDMWFASLGALANEALPTLMRKVIAHALEAERKPPRPAPPARSARRP